MAHVPESLLASWDRGNERFHQLLDVLQLCTDGIARTPYVAKYAEVQDKLLVEYGIRAEGADRGVAHLQKLATNAKSESNLGFPTVHALVVTSLWSIAENTVEDFLLEWMKFDEGFLRRDVVPRAKVSLAELMALEEDERLRYILNEIGKHLGCGSARGIEKFEKLLNLCGLGGAVEDGLRRDMLELSEVRNVIVHRGALVDRRFLQACPWIALKAGDKIVVDQATCGRYIRALDGYMGNVMLRLVKKFKESPEIDHA